MVSQVIEFTDREITRERSYLNMYNKGTISVQSLRISNLINLDYYNNILSTEVVLSSKATLPPPQTTPMYIAICTVDTST